MKQTFLLFISLVVGLLLATSVYAEIPVLNQSSVTVGVGQVIMVTSSNTNVYVTLNSQPAAATVLASGSQISVTGVQTGTTSATICAAGSATDCTNLSVTVQAAAVQSVTLTPGTVSVVAGATQSVAVSSGTPPYNLSSNSASSVAVASLASSTLTVTGVDPGTTTLTVCDSLQSCSSVTATVTGSATTGNQNVNFNPANPTLSAGQSTSLTLSSPYTNSFGNGFSLFYNSNPDALTATVDGTALNLQAVKSGPLSVTVTVCATGGGCDHTTVSITGTAASSPAPTPTPTPTPGTLSPTPLPISAPVATPTTTDLSSFLAQIQAMQSQITQMLSQIQSMSGTLTQLASSVRAKLQQGAVLGSSTSAPSAPATSFTQFLTRGSVNGEVTLLQNVLTKLGFYSGPVNGSYGPVTEAAVEAYQKARGITPLGSVGPTTRQALNADK